MNQSLNPYAPPRSTSERYQDLVRARSLADSSTAGFSIFSAVSFLSIATLLFNKDLIRSIEFLQDNADMLEGYSGVSFIASTLITKSYYNLRQTIDDHRAELDQDNTTGDYPNLKRAMQLAEPRMNRVLTSPVMALITCTLSISEVLPKSENELALSLLAPLTVLLGISQVIDGLITMSLEKHSKKFAW